MKEKQTNKQNISLQIALKDHCLNTLKDKMHCDHIIATYLRSQSEWSVCRMIIKEILKQYVCSIATIKMQSYVKETLLNQTLGIILGKL